MKLIASLDPTQYFEAYALSFYVYEWTTTSYPVGTELVTPSLRDNLYFGGIGGLRHSIFIFVLGFIALILCTSCKEKGGTKGGFKITKPGKKKVTGAATTNNSFTDGGHSANSSGPGHSFPGTFHPGGTFGGFRPPLGGGLGGQFGGGTLGGGSPLLGGGPQFQGGGPQGLAPQGVLGPSPGGLPQGIGSSGSSPQPRTSSGGQPQSRTGRELASGQSPQGGNSRPRTSGQGRQSSGQQSGGNSDGDGLPGVDQIGGVDGKGLLLKGGAKRALKKTSAHSSNVHKGNSRRQTGSLQRRPLQRGVISIRNGSGIKRRIRR